MRAARPPPFEAMTRSDRSHAPRSGRERSQRQLRVGEMLRHELVDILGRGDLHDPALAETSVTVGEVRVSPDLRNATVYVMPLGGAGAAEIVSALERAAPFLRRQLGKRVMLRHLPTLSFAADSVFDEGARIEALLRSPAVARDLARPPDNDDPDGP